MDNTYQSRMQIRRDLIATQHHEVIGLNPIQQLVVPRLIAATFVAVLLFSVVSVTGLVGSYIFVVYVQHVTPGAFVSGMTSPRL